MFSDPLTEKLTAFVRGTAIAVRAGDFTTGNYIALSQLQWPGMTVDSKNAVERGVAQFPRMLRWMR